MKKIMDGLKAAGVMWFTGTMAMVGFAMGTIVFTPEVAKEIANRNK